MKNRKPNQLNFKRLKLEAVEAVFRDTRSVDEVCDERGIDRDELVDWTREIAANGVGILREQDMDSQETWQVRIGGPLLNPKATGVLRSTLLNNIPNTQKRRYYDRIVQVAEPSLNSIPRLLDDVWAVLEGNPIAAQRFRSHLLMFASGAKQTRLYEKIALYYQYDMVPGHLLHQDAKPAATTTQLDLLPMERFVPFITAVVRVATSPEDLALLLGCVENGLRGLDEMAELYRAATRSINTRDLRFFDDALKTLETRIKQSDWKALDRLDRPLPRRTTSDIPQLPLIESKWDKMLPDQSDDGYEQVPMMYSGGGDETPPYMRFYENIVWKTLIVTFDGKLIIPQDTYYITGISPDYACPGDILNIKGVGFGSKEDSIFDSSLVTVYFTDEHGDSIPIIPLSVSPSLVTVDVPDDAVNGPVWLGIRKLEKKEFSDQFGTSHDFFITTNITGNSVNFRSGQSHINLFTINGSSSDLTVSHTSGLYLMWSCEPPETHIRLIQDGDVLFEGSYASWDYDIADPGASGELTFTLEAAHPDSSCDVVSRSIVVCHERPRPVLKVEAVEITQGIQTLWNPGNVALIPGKDTVVRVYISSDYPVEVTGQLLMDGRTYQPVNQNKGANPFITVDDWTGLTTDDKQNVRRDNNGALNFRIPASECNSTKLAHIDIFAPAFCSPFPSVSIDYNIVWQPISYPLPVKIRRIRDPDGNVRTEDEVIETVVKAFDLLPSAITEITVISGTVNLEGWQLSADYKTDIGLAALVMDLDAEHTSHEPMFRKSAIWLGMTYRFNRGLTWINKETCVSCHDYWRKTAHELTHTAGLGHVPPTQCENIAQPIPCERLPNEGLLDDVPFDVRRNRSVGYDSGKRIYVYDIMTYDELHILSPSRRWTHPIHWEKIYFGFVGIVSKLVKLETW